MKNSWEYKKLIDLGTFSRGISKHRPRNDKILFTNGKYPFVQTSDVKKANLYIKSNSEFYNETGLSQSKLWPKGTLCITIAANIAETGILAYPMCFPDSIVGFTANKNYSSELFMYYVFEYLKQQIQNQASGSIQDNINIEYLTNLKIRMPDKKSQDTISDLLSTLDKKIITNNAITQQLESMAKTIYDYWFLQFEFPNEEGKPYKSSGGKMVWNEELQQEIPEGWEVNSISSFIDSKKNGDWGKASTQGNYVLPVSCIRGADLGFITGKDTSFPPTRFILEKNSRKLLKPYDIVIEISGGSPNQSTGRIAGMNPYLFDRFDNGIICSNFCKAITLKNKINFYYLLQTWKLLFQNNVMFNWEGKTSGIKNLMFDSFAKNTKIVIPAKQQLTDFFELFDSVDHKIQSLLKENQQLMNLRDFLLPLLMNGQVSVEEKK